MNLWQHTLLRPNSPLWDRVLTVFLIQERLKTVNKPEKPKRFKTPEGGYSRNIVLAWRFYLIFQFLWNDRFIIITGCPKSSFLYFISPYFSTIELVKQIIETDVVYFNLIYYFHTFCAIFWLEYSICVLPRQRCASIFSSHIFFVFYNPNCSNSFLVFCEYHER